MWENAAPLPENEPPRPPARCAGSEEDLVLWAQILLCLAAIGLVLAAGALDWPVYPELRRAFTAAMQPEQSLLLGEERNLLKFTEQTAGELADSASPELASIRRHMRATESKVRDILQRILSSSQSKYLQENIITQRSGRTWCR